MLIVDDASPDGSVDIAKGIAERDDRVRVLAHERNCGHIATYNEGLALCKGDYTVLLSADDLLVPGALARATAVFARYPGVGFVYGRTVSFTEPPLPAPNTGTGQPSARATTVSVSQYAPLTRRTVIGRRRAADSAISDLRSR